MHALVLEKSRYPAARNFVIKDESHCGRPQYKFGDPSLQCFDKAAECDVHTDRKTDKQTDASTITKTREASLHAVARKNNTLAQYHSFN